MFLSARNARILLTRTASAIVASRSTFYYSPFHELLANLGGITTVKQRHGAATRRQMSWQLAHDKQKYDADQHGRQPGLILTDGES